MAAMLDNKSIQVITGRLFTGTLCAVCALLPLSSVAAPAHFWLAEDGVSTAGPNVATNIRIDGGSVGTLYIWGRPETGKKLRNISLNVVSLQAGIDFIDSSIAISNDAGGGQQRFEYVSDASSTPALTSEETLAQVIGGAADSIELLQGYSISAASASIQGVGDQCVGGETGCIIAADDQPAWLIASVDYHALLGGPLTEIHLQIGEHGINHESLVPGDYDRNGVVDQDDLSEVQANFSSTLNLWPDGNDNGRVDAADYTVWRDHLGSVSTFETAALSSVRFGADTIDGVDEPIYDASIDRDVTLALDDPDATITITAPLAAAPLTVPEPSALHLVMTLLVGCRSVSLCWRRPMQRSALPNR